MPSIKPAWEAVSGGYSGNQFGIELILTGKLTLSLCNTCAENFYGSGAYFLRRVDPVQVEKELCTYCNQRIGFDYEITPRRKQK